MISASESKSWSTMTSKLRSFVGKRIRSPADRDDVVQNILLRVLVGLPDLQDPKKLGPWVYRIAKNAVVDHWHRHSGEASTSLPEDWHVSENQNEDAVVQSVASHFHHLIRQLPQPYQDALIMTELESLTHRRAAAMANVSIAAMKSRVRRGRQLLKDSLEACCRLEVTSKGNLVDCVPRQAGKFQACDSC